LLGSTLEAAMLPFLSPLVLSLWAGRTALPSRQRPAVAQMAISTEDQGVQVATSTEGPGVQAIRRYFGAWNRRDMEAACAEFGEACSYEDTQYAGAFEGKEALAAHLNKVADALPSSFQFCIDEVADGGESVGIQWHVENDGTPLPFTRGCSMYKVDPESGKIISGFDVPEPAPFKPGSASLALLSVASKLIAEPVRAVPLLFWAGYVSIVFFSNGILPGPDATQLDGDTWVEVLDLSLNFWLVAPLLNLPFAPSVHPMLEALFNGLLAWAAAFAGFLSDGRPGRPNGSTGNSMLPVVGGMQLLTNAFLLPYLVIRPNEEPSVGESLCLEDLDGPSRTVGESRALPLLLAAVFTGSLFWGALARPEFGDLGLRWASFCDILGSDRLASSFVVDMVLFSFFQGWLVDDDLLRRGVALTEATGLRALCRFVPFFGLVGYLAARPPLPSRERGQAQES